MASNHTTQAIASGDLVDLVSSSGAATIYPSDDAILGVLQARFRADLPYTRVGTTNLVVVNPYKTLASVNDASAKEYEERCYKDTAMPMADSPKPLQPHLYDLAARVYLLMRRRNESQGVVARGITGSGKSTSLRLFMNQILRLSTHSKKEAKVSEQIKAFATVLDAFGNAKTLMSPNASRHGRYFELHFNERGRINSAKVLAFGLDKSRLTRLAHEERTFHIFYQFLAGATSTERDFFNLEDPSDYALLASSGCYRLPAGPFSDDSIAMADLRAAMRTLGFKAKHMASIFSLLVAILLLGNLQFHDGDAHDVSAYIANAPVLEHAARLLGVSAEDLSQTLTNRTSYVRKELYTVFLNAQQSSAQRDQLVRDLYAILFAYIVETSNHRIAPSVNDPIPPTQIILFDQPGHQSRGPSGTASMSLSGPMPLVSAYGQNSFDEFAINFADELVHSYVLRHTFEDAVGYNSHLTGDGVALPTISTMDNGACVELLRGAALSERSQRKPGGLLGVINKACSSFKSGKLGDHKNEDLLQDLVSKFGVHASFVASPAVGGAQDRNLFGINHYAGSVSYDVTSFIEKDTDILDSAFVPLLRSSSDSFVSKLLSGPSLATEKHSKDDNIVVQAQVSSFPLRPPTPILRSNGSRSSIEVHSRLDPNKVYPFTTQINFTLSELFSTLDQTKLWTISCIRPNDSGSSNSFDKRRVKAQIRSLLLPDIASRRSVQFIVDYGHNEFCERYVPTMRGSDIERITQCARANGWREGEDFVVGHRSVWLSYSAWKTVEDGIRAVEKEVKKLANNGAGEDDESALPDDATEYTHDGGLSVPEGYYNESADNLLASRSGPGGGYQDSGPNYEGYGGGGLPTPNLGDTMRGGLGGMDDSGVWGRDDKVPSSPSAPPYSVSKEADGLVVNPAPNAVEELPTSRTRRVWLWMVWALTGIIPTFLLTHLGRMKRPDVRLAWREKLTIFLLIFLLNALVVFYIVAFGKLLCPEFDKAWSLNEVAQHTASNDFWVTIHGFVYDVTDYIGGNHVQVPGLISNGRDTKESVAGQDLSYYFPPPLTLACPGLVEDDLLELTIKNLTNTNIAPTVMHKSGRLASVSGTSLAQNDWYTSKFLPTINQYRKGPLVYKKDDILGLAQDEDVQKIWGIWNEEIYDFTDYVHSQSANPATISSFQFINSDITDVFQQQSGRDVTERLEKVLASLDEPTRAANVNCIKNLFFTGRTDFRTSPRCLVANYILLAVAGVIMASMLLKFLAALQLGSKRSPELQDKFILCQVPCYTEGEDSLRRTIDSLAALNYDDKRKLIFIICDGNIIGSGNDRTTPRIVLDILGVDPKLDPEPLLFKSVGEGSRALNYGKIYSGLYEFEGHVVPYMVVVKVGKPTERSKPGNRGKRDSQILLMHYLNRVHFDAPMSPLELEIYHQMRNVIGIDPAFYEYIFTVDADTTVTPEALNRLVATCADDSSIIGVCGETKLENEEGSWWTMIQVYEYYISHHLSKAFESLFGSVTCLPGCFSLYRIRTADKGRPIIISNRIIEEYAEPNVDTLHKKNLFSLGEDRFLTTLMMKHFPTFKTKFCADALAHTMAPESWRILFSQRRRWINSTVHNLCELILLPELFGFCCFSMRFFVFIDLLSTLILPSTVVYLVYLIVTVATQHAPLPIISIIMIAAVYGLQAIIFIIKREFMLIGWMVVYILSYPVYSFFLPVYSYWCMDEFGWGNTRLVIGEGKDKKVIVNEDDKFDDSMIPLKKFSEYEAEAWERGSQHSGETGYSGKPRSRAPASREESPHTYHQASHAGDYYRDTNLTASNRHGGSQQSHTHTASIHHGQQPAMSQYGSMPQLPFMPFGGGPGSVAGSDYGGPTAAMGMGMGPIPYQATGGSMYGMMGPGAVPRNTMMPSMNMFGGSFGGSQSGQSGGFMPPPAIGGARPISTFSMATTANPFAGPSLNPNPTDDELFTALRNYLSTQDLMTVTKKTAREAMTTKFPKADLSSRKEFLNSSIDKILSES